VVEAQAPTTALRQDSISAKAAVALYLGRTPPRTAEVLVVAARGLARIAKALGTHLMAGVGGMRPTLATDRPGQMLGQRTRPTREAAGAEEAGADPPQVPAEPAVTEAPGPAVEF
jgi:hypothetical protein